MRNTQTTFLPQSIASPRFAFVALFGLAGFLAPAFMAPAFANVPTGPHISMTGMGEVQAKPDSAQLSLQVRAEEDTSLAAKTVVDTRVNKLLAGLKRFGILESDISASSLTTEPNVQYRDGENKTLGYRARRTLTVTLKNLNQLNDFMDFALSVEINEINNIRLTASNADELNNQALAAAVENAKQQARQLAQSFDAELGTVYSINAGQTSSRFAYGAHEMRAMMADVATPGRYLEETITFSATINVVFNLTPLTNTP